jgi:PAS domain S-box-containing protein
MIIFHWSIVIGTVLFISGLIYALRQQQSLILSSRNRFKKIHLDRINKIGEINTLQTAILNDASYAIIATDLNGIITLFNPAAEKMVGYDAEELVGRQTPALFHDPKEVLTRASLFSAELNEPITPGFDVFIAKTRRGLPNGHEWTYVRKDGKRLLVMLAISALRNNKKEITGYLGIASDISNQHKGQSDLLAARNQLTIAAEVAELGIWRWNLANNELTWNDRMLEMYQVSKHTRESGLNFEHWRSRLHPDDVEATVSSLMRAVEGQGEFNPVFRILWPDGSLHYTQAGAQIERNDEGKAIHVTGINRDITNQHNYEELLTSSKIRAEEANKAKSEFLANMSHEIRTPMNAILGMLQLLERTALTPTQKNYLDKVNTAGHALLNLLNDILDLSKIEANKIALYLQPTNIDHMLSNLSPLLSIMLGKKNIEILINIDPNLPKWIIADALRLQQVLLNLCSNALKFTEQGEVEITLQMNQQNKKQVTITFSIYDTGIGISPKQQQIIFDSFSQAEASTTRRFGGTGLGLAISQKLVRLMDGELSVKSKLGQGSTFFFRLNFKRALIPGESAQIIHKKLQKLRCLVVDDHPKACELTSNILLSFGWHVEQANSGPDAIKKISLSHQDHPYDIIYMDLKMPHLDGWETSKQLHQYSAKKPIPIILMTTAFDKEQVTQQQNMAAFINGTVEKPITPSMLYDAAATALLGVDSKMTAIKTKPSTNARLSNVRLLVVEDSATNQMIAHDLLVNEGAIITLADNGQAAMEAAKNAHPLFDAILMDIQMPIVDGYTASRNIREYYTSQELPIIAISANTELKDQNAAKAAGMNDFIAKPFEINELVLTIERNIQKNNNPSTPEKIALNKPEKLVLLDTVTALQRMGGNQIMYERGLKQFAVEIKRLLKALPKKLDQHVKETAETLHTIKGLASTMGAAQFAATVSYLYQHIETKDLARDWPELHQDLMKQGKEVIVAAAHFQKNNTSKRTSQKTPKLSLSDLYKLLAFLETNNMEALKLYDQLQPSFTVHYPSWLKKLDRAMNQLDFASAASYCHALIEGEKKND